jgi:putative phosphoesterase
MRVAVISDLHGHDVALEAVLADAARAGVDGHVCLGDVVDLGPRPGEVVDRLRAIRCPVVCGNHDPLDEHPVAKPLAAVEAWTRDRLTPEQRTWLEELPAAIDLDLGGLRLLCVHGSPRSDEDPVLATTPVDVLEGWIGDRAFDVLVCGHSHLQMIRRLGARTIVNAGSVGMPFVAPFDGRPPRILPWAEYAVLSADQGHLSIDLRRVPYDFDAFRASLRASGFPDPEGWLAAWVAR